MALAVALAVSGCGELTVGEPSGVEARSDAASGRDSGFDADGGEDQADADTGSVDRPEADAGVDAGFDARPPDGGAPDVDAAPPVDDRLPVVVAVGYGGLRMHSDDGGLTWSAPQTDPWLEEQVDPNCSGPDCERRCRGGDDRCLLRAVTWANGLFVATGWKIFTSLDGSTWTERTVDGQQWCGGVAYGAGRFVCIGGCGNYYGSTDGLEWERLGNATAGCGHLRRLAFGNGVFVSTGDGERVITSSTGLAWSELDVNDLGTLVFHDGQFFAQPRDRRADYHYTSSDGETWTRRDGALQLYYGHGRFFRVTGSRDRGRIIETSEDGETWTERASGIEHAIQGFAFGWRER